MSGEAAFLALVILGFSAFMVTLAYGSAVTWRMHRLERSRIPPKAEVRDAA